MFGEFHISKKDFDTERVKHQYYLEKNDFSLQLPNDWLSNETLFNDLKKLGYWYQALEKGEIKPITYSQDLFVKGIKSNCPTGQIGKSWFIYKKYRDTWGELNSILQRSSTNELEIISKILFAKEKTPKSVLDKLQSLSQNLIEVLEETSYRDILIKVQKILKLQVENLPDGEIERAITQNVLNQTLSKMSKDEKDMFEKEIIEIAKKEGHDIFKTGAVFATLTAANLSGFGVYMLATTTLSSISGIIGITLPFAAYTGLSSAIAFLTGPVGWIGAGLFALWKFTDVDYKKLVPAIVYIHWLREKYKQ